MVDDVRADSTLRTSQREWPLENPHAAKLQGVLDKLMLACKLKFDKAESLIGASQAYAYRCVQAEYSMRFSEVFLARCFELAKADNQPFWASYFERHLEEEAGHHAWAQSDLAIVNECIAHNWEVSEHTKKAIDKQLKYIDDGEFFPQLGYCICVESYQGERSYWEELCTRTEVPVSGFKNALRHCVIDQQHSAELWEVYEQIPTRSLEIVATSAISTAVFQLAAFSSLAEGQS